MKSKWLLMGGLLACCLLAWASGTGQAQWPGAQDNSLHLYYLPLVMRVLALTLHPLTSSPNGRGG